MSIGSISFYVHPAFLVLFISKFLISAITNSTRLEEKQGDLPLYGSVGPHKLDKLFACSEPPNRSICKVFQ